jgi:hypothetical protein
LKYKCTGKLHIWGWHDFKDAINGKIVDYSCIGSIVISIVYEVDAPISKDILSEYGVLAEIVSN